MCGCVMNEAVVCVCVCVCACVSAQLSLQQSQKHSNIFRNARVVFPSESHVSDQHQFHLCVCVCACVCVSTEGVLASPRSRGTLS